MYSTGEVQTVNGAPFSEHSSVASASSTVISNVGVVSVVTASGCDVIATTGALRSPISHE